MQVRETGPQQTRSAHSGGPRCPLRQSPSHPGPKSPRPPRTSSPVTKCAASPTTAFALSRPAAPDTLHHTPIGVFRNIDRPVYDTLMAGQLDTAIDNNGKGELTTLLTGDDTWTVPSHRVPHSRRPQ